MSHIYSSTRFATLRHFLLRNGLILLIFSCAVHSLQAQPAQFTQGQTGSNTVSLQVPLGSYPGRHVNVPINLNYSSRVWRIGFIKRIYYMFGGSNSLAEAIYSEYATAGWTTSLDVPRIEWPKQNDLFWYDGKPYTRGTVQPYTKRVPRVYIHMPDGTTHELRRSDQPYQDLGYIDMSGTFYAVDGTRMRYDCTGEFTGTLYLADGTRYILNGSSAQYIDRNGNTLNYDGSTRQWTDTLGRVIGMPWPANPSATDYYYSVPGVNGSTVTYIIKFRNLSNALTPGSPALQPMGDYYLPFPNDPPTDYNGSNFTQPTNTTSMFASGYSDPDEMDYQAFTRVIGRGQSGANVFNPVVLSEIVLPNGQSYKFSYNNFGELDKVIYPSGSYQRYAYAQVPPFGQSLVPYQQGSRGATSRWASANGLGTDEVQWQYQSTKSGSTYTITVTAPNGLRTVTNLHNFGTASNTFGHEDARNGMPFEEIIYAPAAQGGAMLRRTLTEWTSSSATYTRPSPGTGTYTAYRNPRPVKMVNISLDTGGDALASASTYAYDTTYQFNVGVDRTVATDFAYTTVNQTTAQTGAISTIPLGALVRSTETAYLTSNVNYRNRNILGLPTSMLVRDAVGTILAQTTSAYDEAAYPLITYGPITGWTDPFTSYRGNLTTSSRWLNFPASTWIQNHSQYDQAGSVKNVWDALGRQTQLDYSSTYAYAYPTTTTTPVPDGTGTYAQTTGLVTTAVYDFNTGLVTSNTDPNGRTTSFEYNDSLNRRTKINLPDGGWTSTSYNDVPGNIYVRTQTLQRTTPSQQLLESYQYFDNAGRPVRTFTNEGGSYITGDTQYDSLGRVWRISNPYRTTSLSDPVNPSGQWVTNTYDVLSRIINVVTSDAAQNVTSYGYSLTAGNLGFTVTASDQLGKTRKSVRDALGRVTQVIEDPNGLAYVTNYTYDVLDNLRKVEQGTQLRYFGYDSLSRVIRVRHVEQAINTGLAWTDPVTGYSGWSAGFTYDANGNMSTRVDARNITTTFTYDSLNRPTTVRYTNDPQNTAGVNKYYDGYRQGTNNNIPNSKGRAFQAETIGQVMFTVDGYDVMGRTLTTRQQFWTGSAWSSSYQVSASYNLAGRLTGVTYPSGRTVAYDYDTAGRLITFSGNLGNGVNRTYSSGIIYAPFGGMTKEQFGTTTPIYNKLFYNSRGQLSEIRDSTSYTGPTDTTWNRGAIINHYSYQCWGMCTGSNMTDNNGMLKKQDVYVPNDDQVSGYTMRWQEYNYDSLNRLDWVREMNGASTEMWKQQFTYDRWGNRTINTGTTYGTGINNKLFSVDTTTNRLGVPVGQSGAMSYDNNGNLSTDTYSGMGARTYDAENHMISAWGGNNQLQTYAYSGSGQRVRRKVDGVEVWQIFGFGSELLAEYAANAPAQTPQKEYGYRNGQLLLTASSPETIYVGDSLPAGAVPAGDGEGWNWVSSNPTPFSGSSAHQSNIVSGVHQHYFYNASATLPVSTGDKLIAYVYIDPANVPAQIMLQWNDGGSWEHRAYWGANNIGWGTDGTNSRRYMGPLPATGQWVRLEVPASQVGLEGLSINGVAFTMFNGRATWDHAGKSTGSGTTDLRWLVSDHLGTPRMVFDQSGSLAATRRHDYLPFGEELFAPVNGRSTAQGYSPEPTRQRFTAYESDVETGLNYAQARYQSPVQGRFVSVDPLGASATIGDPQTFNRYTYVVNNPTNLTDPTGMMPGAEYGWSSVQDGFWGSAIPFNVSHFGGPAIIAAAEARHDELVQARIDGMRALRYLQQGNVEAANNIFRNNSNVGQYVNGEARWGADAINESEGTVEVVSAEITGVAGAPEPPQTGTGPAGSTIATGYDATYNCMAWGLGYDDRWISPNDGPGIYEGTATGERILHPGATVTPATLPGYYGATWIRANQSCPAGTIKLKVYEDSNNASRWHVIRKDHGSSTWTSKNGAQNLFTNIKNPDRFYREAYHPTGTVTITTWCAPRPRP